MRVPPAPAAWVAVEGQAAVESRPGWAAGQAAWLQGMGTHAPWLPEDCKRAGNRTPGCWSPLCSGLGYL